LFRRLKAPVIWYELLLFIVACLLGLALYQMGYTRGFDDGSQYVIDRLKDKLEQFDRQNPLPPKQNKWEKKEGVMS